MCWRTPPRTPWSASKRARKREILGTEILAALRAGAAEHETHTTTEQALDLAA
jgi:hypothetical protein